VGCGDETASELMPLVAAATPAAPLAGLVGVALPPAEELTVLMVRSKLPLPCTLSLGVSEPRTSDIGRTAGSRPCAAGRCGKQSRGCRSQCMVTSLLQLASALPQAHDAATPTWKERPAVY
jgi:hypothetical protein